MKTLVTLPTQHTKDRLSRTFLSAPLSIDLEGAYVVLGYLPDETVSDQPMLREIVFSARFTQYGILFNSQLGKSELVGTLSSLEMSEVAQQYGVAPDFEPKFVFLPYAPSQSQSVRNFNVSVADTLIMKEGLFSFHNVYLL